VEVATDGGTVIVTLFGRAASLWATDCLDGLRRWEVSEWKCGHGNDECD
jgi:hypothetical protein